MGTNCTIAWWLVFCWNEANFIQSIVLSYKDIVDSLCHNNRKFSEYVYSIYHSGLEKKKIRLNFQNFLHSWTYNIIMNPRKVYTVYDKIMTQFFIFNFSILFRTMPASTAYDNTFWQSQNLFPLWTLYNEVLWSSSHYCWLVCVQKNLRYIWRVPKANVFFILKYIIQFIKPWN